MNSILKHVLNTLKVYELQDLSLILGQKNTEIGDRYVEMMVMVDKAALERHANDEEVKRYVVANLKLVSVLFAIFLNCFSQRSKERRPLDRIK